MVYKAGLFFFIFSFSPRLMKGGKMHSKLKLAAGLLGLSLAFGMSIEVQAAGDAAAGKARAMVCMACHGADGNGGADPLWPKLAGQHADYIMKQLHDFKSGKRTDPIMTGMAAPLNDTDIANLAAYFSSQKTKPGMAKSEALVKIGEKLFRGGDTKMGITACMACHGPSGMGIPPRYPRVAGQNQAYTTKQLLAFKNGTRTNDGQTMTRIAFLLSEDQIKALSDYMAGLHE
jgi:cytochrome c553